MQLFQRIGHRDIDAAAVKRRDVLGDIQAGAVFVVERDDFVTLRALDAVLNGSDLGFQLSVCLGESVGRTFLVELFKGLIRSKDTIPCLPCRTPTRLALLAYPRLPFLTSLCQSMPYLTMPARPYHASPFPN